MKKSILFIWLFLKSGLFCSQNSLCFSTPPDSPQVPTVSSALDKADFNHDGFTDICAQSTEFINPGYAFAVSIYFSDGLGGFSASSSFTLNPINISAALKTIEQIKTGDFNGDGEVDVVVVCANDSNFYVLKGSASGTFTSVATFSLPYVPESLALSDFNNDGKTDLVFSGSASNIIYVELGNGSGNFLGTQSYTLTANVTQVIAVDLDNNSKADLLAITGGVSNILKGSGNGTFTISAGPVISAGGISVGDVDGNNFTDIIYTNVTGNSVSVLKGIGNFLFSAVQSYSVPVNSNILVLNPVRIGDYNNDGKKDIAVISGDVYLSLLLGNGSGNFLAPVNYSVYTNSSSALNALYNFINCDINNDLKEDLVGLANDFGLTPMASLKVFLNCSPVGIKQEFAQHEKEIEVFPNPAKEFLQIRFLDKSLASEYLKITIWDGYGKIFQELETNFRNENMELNTEKYKNGIYYFQLSGNSNRSTFRKFIISR